MSEPRDITVHMPETTDSGAWEIHLGTPLVLIALTDDEIRNLHRLIGHALKWRTP
jgi:hypothetical protein